MMSCGHLPRSTPAPSTSWRGSRASPAAWASDRATFEEALADAMRKYTGPNPTSWPARTFTTAAVHLCMKDPALNSAPVGGTPCGG